MFIYPFVTHGILPAGFGYPAGIGDAFNWDLGPYHGRDGHAKRPNAVKWAVAWNLFGTLDLIDPARRR